MNKKLFTLVAIIFAVALFRVLPHPPNVSPVAAMALLGGAYFTDKRMAFILPFLALFLSDLIIGFHNSMIVVYAGFALTVGMGIWMQKKITANRVAATTVASTLLFFIISNFGAWMMTGMYPMNAGGLLQAYVAGIPFLQNSLLGNLAFSAVMFAGFAMMQRQFFREHHA